MVLCIYDIYRIEIGRDEVILLQTEEFLVRPRIRSRGTPKLVGTHP